MDEHDEDVTLRLSGEKADQGIELTDLERFLRHFVGALRGFDRVGRSKPAVRGGQPERREREAAAFRIVGLTPGSTVLTLEPVSSRSAAGEALFEAEHLALDNMRGLTEEIADGHRLDSDVAEALEQARRALGADEGAIEISLPSSLSVTAVRLDQESIERLRPARDEPAEVTRISGRLHLIDLEPDRIGVRSPQGVDWTCEFHESLEGAVKTLIDQIVIVEGQGTQRSSRSGSMRMTAIKLVNSHEQSVLFGDSVSGSRELMEAQGVPGPQGLAALGDAEWEDNDESDRFLEYVLGRS